jgi:hypothetical protein
MSGGGSLEHLCVKYLPAAGAWRDDARIPGRYPRTPQRNRNELGETTVNKTWRKHLPQQEKSTT